MTGAPPSGYALVDLGKGYSERFGPVFVDRAGRRLSFRVDERHLNPVQSLITADGRRVGRASATYRNPPKSGETK